MLAHVSSKVTCCLSGGGGRVAAIRASSSSSSANADGLTSNHGRKSRDKQARIFRRVLKAAVQGQKQLDEGSSSYASGTKTTYADHGFKRTPSRGLKRSEVDLTSPSTPSSSERPRTRPCRSAFAGSSQMRDFSVATSPSSPTSVRHLQHAPLHNDFDSVATSLPPMTTDALDEVGGEIELDDGEQFAPVVAVRSKGKTKARLSEPGRLAPGSWVEMRRSGIVLTGVLTGRSTLNARSMSVLTAGGGDGESSAVEDVHIDDITFVLPGFTSPVVASRCATAAPDDQVVLSLLQQLRHLEIRVEREMRSLTEKGARDLYRRLRSGPVAQRASCIDTTQALRALRLPPDAAAETHLAMHRLFMADPLHFIADPVSLRTSGLFTLRRNRELHQFERVREWVRMQSPELYSFAEKAAKVRKIGLGVSRDLKHDPSIAHLRRFGASQSIQWDANDLDIITFLHSTLDHERAIQAQPYLAIAPSIIKLVDENSRAAGDTVPYPGDDVGRQRIMAFLAEIGVVAPWENWIVHEGQSQLATWDTVSHRVGTLSLEQSPGNEDEPVSAPLPDTENASSVGKASAPPTRRPRPNYYVADAHDSVRRDFGQLPVYTIDDAGAMELDDGISIERAPPTATGSSTWRIHVHVADPTALILPTHPLARVARMRDHTEYFPERVWSMLPDWFVIDEQLSLGSLLGSEQKTVTISMRVTEEGEVIESDFKVGIIRKVQRLTYSAVDEVLGADKSSSSRVVLSHPLPPPNAQQFNQKLVRHTDDEALPSNLTAKDDLSTLYRLSKAMLKRRVDNNALYWSFPAASVSVSPSLRHHTRPAITPQFYRNAPLVKLALPLEMSSLMTPAQLLVSEMMVAANRAAAKFSVERGIPMAFRSQAAPVTSAPTLEKVMACRNPETGEAKGEDILRLGIEFLTGKSSVDPLPHWPMGISDDYGYTKVTSPLRRYADLFGHWQLKSSLLPPSTPSSTFPPTLPRSAVLAHIQQFDNAQKSRGRLSKHAEHFWACYLLKAKLDAPDGDKVDPAANALLRGPLSALAIRQPSYSKIDSLWVQPVLLPELGLRATLACLKEAQAPAMGESVSVKIQDIRLGTRSRLLVQLA